MGIYRLGTYVFILPDSKSLYLEDFVKPSDTLKINFIYRSGFIISHPHVKLTMHRNRSSLNPIVLIWLGTCEFAYIAIISLSPDIKFYMTMKNLRQIL